MTLVRVKENEPFDVALRRFRKKVEESGVLQEIMDRQGYLRPGLKRNKAHAAAVMRWRREVEKSKLPKRMY